MNLGDGAVAPEIDSRPETIVSSNRSTMVVMLPAQRRLVTSPDWEATCLIDSSDPRDADWSPDWDQVSMLLHSLPAQATRVSIVFERRDGSPVVAKKWGT